MMPIQRALRWRCASKVWGVSEHRIGFFEDDGLTPVTAETRAAVRAAAAALRDAGFVVEPFRPRTLEKLAQTVVDIFCAVRRDVL